MLRKVAFGLLIGSVVVAELAATPAPALLPYAFIETRLLKYGSELREPVLRDLHNEWQPAKGWLSPETTGRDFGPPRVH
jgi:hypothetical protein